MFAAVIVQRQVFKKHSQLISRLDWRENHLLCIRAMTFSASISIRSCFSLLSRINAATVEGFAGAVPARPYADTSSTNCCCVRGSFERSQRHIDSNFKDLKRNAFGQQFFHYESQGRACSPPLDTIDLG